MTVRVLIHGALGRMGTACVRALQADAAAATVAAFDRSPGNVLGVNVSTDLSGALADSDVVIDFSSPAATANLARACRDAKKAAVIGTTGLDAGAHDAIRELAAVAPVVVAANMSPGVTVLLHLVKRATQLLGDGYDVEITETHHRNKVDAPSGTALRLADQIADAKGWKRDDVLVHGRRGQVGARGKSEIGVHAVRAGDVVGDHTVLFAGEEERIEISHRAHSRDLFARGAVRAAMWVRARKPGMYDMADVLGILREV